MSAHDDGGSAFPQVWHPDMRCDPALTPPGLTVRDYFAAAALQGYLSGWNSDIEPSENITAEDCYKFADAMLKARKA